MLHLRFRTHPESKSKYSESGTNSQCHIIVWSTGGEDSSHNSQAVQWLESQIRNAPSPSCHSRAGTRPFAYQSRSFKTRFCSIIPITVPFKAKLHLKVALENCTFNLRFYRTFHLSVHNPTYDIVSGRAITHTGPRYWS